MTVTDPLGALSVVELGGGIAAAYAGKMLADAGARVDLVEPHGGSVLRRRKASAAMGATPPLAEGEAGALHRHLSARKAETMLPADPAAAVDMVHALCAGADLLVEDGALDRVGLTPAALQAAYPSLGLVRISPWGTDGPAAASPSTEFTLQAETGSLAARGYIDRPPLATAGELGDYVAGSFAAIAALEAWRLARADSRGRVVDLSTFEAMLICMQPYQYVHGQLEPGVLMPRSVDVPSIEPAADGWIGYATITDAQWRSFAAMIGHPELGEDETLRYGIQRFLALDRVQPLIHAYTRDRTVAELVAEAVRRRIPVTPLGTASTVLEMEQFVARGVFRPGPNGDAEPRPPYRLFDPPPSGPAPAAAEVTSPKPTAALRVLDLTAFWAGPMAGFVFAALGADVVKVESVQRPDGMRVAGGIVPRSGEPVWEMSPIFLGVNAGKRSVTLDLTRPAGVDLLKRLIADSDVVLENFSPRVMEGFGLGWDVVRSINPKVVLVRMPAFGLDGPWRDRTGFAMTMEQVSGMAALSGYPDRPPTPPRGCVDPLAGLNAVFAALLALERQAADGLGRLVEVSLAEAGVAVSVEAVLERGAYGSTLERTGNSGPAAVPQAVLACVDADLALSVADDDQWRALTSVDGLATLDREAWRTAAGRRRDEAVIVAQIANWCRDRPTAETAELLLATGVPAAQARNVRTLHHHPQLRARGFFTRFAHAVAGDLDLPNLPFRIDGRYPPLSRSPPLLGEHNREILQGRLGLDDATLERLAEENVIGVRPIGN